MNWRTFNSFTPSRKIPIVRIRNLFFVFHSSRCTVIFFYLSRYVRACVCDCFYKFLTVYIENIVTFLFPLDACVRLFPSLLLSGLGCLLNPKAIFLLCLKSTYIYSLSTATNVHELLFFVLLFYIRTPLRLYVTQCECNCWCIAAFRARDLKRNQIQFFFIHFYILFILFIGNMLQNGTIFVYFSSLYI